MLKKNLSVCLISFLILCILAISACGGSPAAAGGGGSGGSSSSGGSQPNWVKDPYTKYDRQANVAAVGSGTERQTAEKSALGALIAIFGQEIQVDEKVHVVYEEAVKSGVAAKWSENTRSDNTITTSAGMDTLVGAEIGEVWHDTKNNTHYAVAVLNKAKAAAVYRDMINSNQTMINNLTTMSAAEKNTLEGYSRYQFAATVADINTTYANLLAFIGTPFQGLKKGDDYRLEAVNITKAIPVALNVQNDKSARIQGAFAKALTEHGFRTGGTTSRYALNVNVVSSPVTIANNANKWTRIEVSANLTDTSTNTVLVPYNFSSREGHTSQAEADNRAIIAAERKITQEYAGILDNFLSQLLPKK